MSNPREEIEFLGIERSAGYKNLVALRDYTVDTRKKFRALEEEVQNYKNMVLELKQELNQQKSQIQQLQIKLYSKSATT